MASALGVALYLALHANLACGASAATAAASCSAGMGCHRGTKLAQDAVLMQVSAAKRQSSSGSNNGSWFINDGSFHDDYFMCVLHYGEEECCDSQHSGEDNCYQDFPVCAWDGSHCFAYAETCDNLLTFTRCNQGEGCLWLWNGDPYAGGGQGSRSYGGLCRTEPVTCGELYNSAWCNQLAGCRWQWYEPGDNVPESQFGNGYCAGQRPARPTQAPARPPGSEPRREPTCHTTKAGEECHRHVLWAIHPGFMLHPTTYTNLTRDSSFEDFQRFLHMTNRFDCPEPCAVVDGGCHDAVEGEECYRHVLWAMKTGIHANREWYPEEIQPRSSARVFQAWLHKIHHGSCPRPCGV